MATIGEFTKDEIITSPIKKIRQPRSKMQRFMSRVSFLQDSDCWHWTGYKHTRGYPMFDNNSRADVVGYELYVGDVPEGLHVSPACGNKECVNPDHMEVITLQECFKKSPLVGSKTHCKQGHEYTPENTSVRQGKRHCRACQRIHSLNYYRNKSK